jgi:single-stranded DNA-binding protein
MALNIEFDGWLNEVKTLDWGTVFVVTHDNRAKNDAGNWETVSKDWIDVTVPQSDVEAVISATGGAGLVHVTGTLKVGTYDKRDGSTGIKYRVRATSVKPVQRGGNRDVVTTTHAFQNPAPVDDTELPF